MGTVKEEVSGIGEGEVAAFDDDELGSKAMDAAGGFFHGVQIVNREIGENACFRGIWGDNKGYGEDVGDEGGDGVLLKELITVFGDHDGIYDEAIEVKFAKDGGDGTDKVCGGKHTCFSGVSADVVEDRAELECEEFRGNIMNAVNAPGVLCGKCGDGGHAVDAEGVEGFKVGLYAGAAAGIGAGDGEGAWIHELLLFVIAQSVGKSSPLF